MELEVIKMLSLKDSYNKYITLIVTERLSPEAKEIVDSLNEYYTETGHDEVDWDEYYTWYTIVKHPTLSAVKADIIRKMCDELKVLVAPTAAVIKFFLLRDYASQLGDMAFEIVDGNPKYTVDSLDDLVIECKRELDRADGLSVDRNVSSGDLKDRLKTLVHGKTYDWRLNELQLSLGPLKQGDFIIIGARPDSGKTTFLASESTYMAPQLDEGECILWCNNEEDVSRIRSRQVQAALNWTNEEVQKDIDVTYDEYVKAIGGDVERLVVYDNTFMSVTDIDRQIARYNPKIIIIDQLWKLRGFEKQSVSDIDRYGMIAAYLRDIAKKHGPVITTSQIDDKAEGVRYPDMGRLYNSKTAVQGEADVILMIGRDHDEPPNVRFIHAPKNKLSLGVHKFRNACWPVGLDSEHARFTSKITQRK